MINYSITMKDLILEDPSFLPSQSLSVNASLIFSRGYVLDIIFPKGYLSLIATRKSKAIGNVSGV
ncbi:MAG: hypothetical protein CM1200mP37_5700 [Chloroflexota bacterium]|nr:MAG: hypothetical protein CM1200mP37_5700 [Chloroflexota bacterium]